MTKQLTLRELQTIIGDIDNTDNNDVIELIENFPFSSLVDISILNFGIMRLNLTILIKLSKNDRYYKVINAVKYSLEFTITNLLSLENVEADDILLKLLELLKCLIIGMTKNGQSRDILRERERLFDVLLFTAKLKIFNKLHARISTDVIRDLVMINGPLPLTASRNLAEISEIYKGLKLVYDLTLICRVVLKRFSVSTEVFNVCIPWLLLYGPQFLKENQDDVIVLEMLTLMNEFYDKYGHSRNKKCHKKELLETFEDFSFNLMKISDRLIEFSNIGILRNESLKLFSFTVLEYNENEIDVKRKPNIVLKKIMELPVNIKEWPRAKSRIFFYICSFLYIHSRSLWTPSEILGAISSLIYSYQKFTISPTLLKVLCYIFPITMVECPVKSTLVLGDELLKLLIEYSYSSVNVYVYHIAQLIWILKRGDRKFKKFTLCQWFKNDTDVDTLKKAIIHCNAGYVLLDIITDGDVDDFIVTKATEMIHLIQDEEISNRIAIIIPTVLGEETVLNRLLLSNPGLPRNTNMSLRLCEFMSLILHSISSQDVLKVACIYCRNLVTNLKKERNVVTLFCQDMENIQFLTIKIKYVEQETAIEILRLLKVLILVQRRNHNEFDSNVEADFSQYLIGSTLRTEKCLDLLQIIITSKKVLINLDHSTIQNTYINLLDLCKHPGFAVKSMICLTGILKANVWLTENKVTSLFIIIYCSVVQDSKFGSEFLTFLTVWLKILKNNTELNVPFLPNGRTLLNFINTVDYIPRRQVNYLIKLMGALKIIRRIEYN